MLNIICNIVTDSTQNISQILPPPHILQSAQQMGQPPMNHHGPAPPSENAQQQQPIPNPNQSAPMAGPYNHHPPMQNQMPPPGSIHGPQQPQQQSAQVPFATKIN